jgi:HAD superfamily hydrolase (TIGR01509 family)
LKNYQLYLFDMDGTLVNSEPLKGMAAALACQDYGAQMDFNIYKTVMGQRWTVVTEHFFKRAGISPDVTEFNQRFRGHYEQLLSERLELNPGAQRYIKQLISAGKTCGVVSSAARWSVETILNAFNLMDCFDVIITQEDVTAHKPDPAPYHLALSKMTTAPEQTLIFEDSSAGISAGVASGCDVIAFKHEFNGGNDMSQALKVIESYSQLPTPA